MVTAQAPPVTTIRVCFSLLTDYVEEAWRIVDNVLEKGTPVYAYEPGSWGPAAADALTATESGWVNPSELPTEISVSRKRIAAALP
jgi:hypothetical protein